MGVQHLWKLLAPCAKYITIDSLTGKCLAIDASIWLVQFVKAMREGDGKMTPNAPLIGFFRRICRLLYHRIKPVFVFDGPAPSLKKRTLKQRNNLRAKYRSTLQRTAERILLTQLRLKNIQNAKNKLKKVTNQCSGNNSNNDNDNNSQSTTNLANLLNDTSNNYSENSNVNNSDNYGELKDTVIVSDDSYSDNSDSELDDLIISTDGVIDPEVIASLPLRKQYKLLQHQISEDPDALRLKMSEETKNADSFSNIQLSKFLKTSAVKRKITEIRQKLGTTTNINTGQKLQYIASDSNKGILFGHRNNIEAGGGFLPENNNDTINTQQNNVDNSNKYKYRYKRKRTKISVISDNSLNTNIKTDNLFSKWECQECSYINRFIQLKCVNCSSTKPQSNDELPTNNIKQSDKITQDEWECQACSFSNPSELNECSICSASRNEVNVENEVVASTDIDKKVISPLFTNDNIDERKNHNKNSLKKSDHVRDHVSNSSIKYTQKSIAMNGHNMILDLTIDESQSEDMSIDDSCLTLKHDDTMEIDEMDTTNKKTRVSMLTIPAVESKVPVDSTLTPVDESSTVLQGAESSSKTNDDSISVPTNESTMLQGAESSSKTNVDSIFTPVDESSTMLQGAESSSETNVDSILKPVDESSTVLQGAESSSTTIGNTTNSKTANSITEKKIGYFAPGYDYGRLEAGMPAVGLPNADEVKLEQMANDAIVQMNATYKEHRTLQRDTAEVTDEMVSDVKHLLELCGIPYIVSPAEAEAQCAELEMLGLVDGVVTEDSDTLLFGAKNIYRNLFTQKKDIQYYKSDEIEKQFGLTRENLVYLAMLLGSDYTLGVRGIGPVHALEIMQAFPGFDGLNEFRNWVFSDEKIEKPSTKIRESKDPVHLKHWYKYQHRNAKTKWEVSTNFPDSTVIKGYLKPNVDHSAAAFEWAQIDSRNLIAFCKMKFDWNDVVIKRTINSILEERSEGQTNLDHFFPNDGKFSSIDSVRVQKVIADRTGIVQPVHKKSKIATNNHFLNPNELNDADLNLSGNVMVNRSPVLLLWASLVAAKIWTIDWNSAVTLGKSITTAFAKTKGKSLGIDGYTDNSNVLHIGKFRKLMGYSIPIIEQDTNQIVALDDKGQVISANKTNKYLEKAFGANLQRVRLVLSYLIQSFSNNDEELSNQAYQLYTQFRPTIPLGKEGWGKKGELSLDLIRQLANAIKHKNHSNTTT